MYPLAPKNLIIDDELNLERASATTREDFEPQRRTVRDKPIRTRYKIDLMYVLHHIGEQQSLERRATIISCSFYTCNSYRAQSH